MSSHSVTAPPLSSSSSSRPLSMRLNYTIHSCSGYTSTFQPHHILTDNPSDQSSRWTALNTKQPTSTSTSTSTSTTTTSSTNDDRINPTSTSIRSSSSLKRSRDIQYITLELERPAIVTAIGFGKYHKVHPCNLHEFSVYGGMSPELHCMEPLLHAGLKNDSQPEQFQLPIDAVAPRGRPSAVGPQAHTASQAICLTHVDSVCQLLPSKYIRIDALTPHTQNYNVSIWHVWLTGITTDIDSALIAYEEYRSATTTHLILSHLRRSALLPTFHSLLSSVLSSVSSSFEHPRLAQLHQVLVVQGDFVQTELILQQARDEGLFGEWTTGGGKGVSVARWMRLDEQDVGVIAPRPKARAGHQFVRIGRKLLLFGGFDGEKDLGDLWEVDLPRKEEGTGATDRLRWRCLDEGEEERQDWPRARSCHQMTVDESEGCVYMLGARVSREEEEVLVRKREEKNGEGNGEAMDVEGSAGERRNIYASEFWRYRYVGADRGKWELLSEDTAAQSGPKLLFDHQMFVHSQTQRLFVFGGRIQPPDDEDALEDRYSGMYCYDIASRIWSHLFGDPTSNDTFRAERLLGRIGHSMFFDAQSQNLYVLGGQRGDTYLADLWAIKLASPDVSHIDDDEDFDSPATSAGGGDASLWRAGAVIGASLSPSNPSAITTTISSSSATTSAAAMSSSSPSSRSPTILQIKQLSEDVSLPSSIDGSIGPSPSFTHRTTIDPSSREWTMVGGLVKYRQARKEAPSNDVWTRSAQYRKWEKVEARGEAPEPRFAATVVYDPLRKEHYLFGGNPHRGTEERLGDFWRFRIVHPSPDEALRMARFLVRKQRFTEMCQTRPTLIALQYLQNAVGSVVDHTDESEASAFRACMVAVLSAPARNNCEVDERESSEGGESNLSSEHEDSTVMVEGGELYTKRHELFESLLEFVPAKEAQPKEELKDVATQLRRDRA